ncbi:hypothetical protein D3C80_1250300 [compost metagenome]
MDKRVRHEHLARHPFRCHRIAVNVVKDLWCTNHAFIKIGLQIQIPWIETAHITDLHQIVTFLNLGLDDR